MKKAIIAAAIAIYFLSISAVAQVRPALTANNHQSTTRTASRTAPPTPGANPEATRSRVANTGGEASKSNPTLNTPAKAPRPAWGNAPLSISERPRVATANVEKTTVATANSSTAPTISTAPTNTYRVGVGDILDIQIPDSLSSRSTLYTVTDGGLLDYPLVGAPVQIAGLTTEAIAQRLRTSIKVLDNPDINVKVREYASHSVNVIGFVSLPGPKILRREAVPLYVVLAESMPLAEAVSVTIIRQGKEVATVNLRDQNATSQLLVANDVLKVLGSATAPAEYFFAGGEVNAPGQKAFHSGLTLTQAILASGGTTRNADNVVRVSRQTVEGRLMTTEYNLKNIQNGKVTDPLLQKGDRIEIPRN